MNEISKYLMKQLKQIEKESPLNINELRIITALERVVARIQASSELSEYIVFKGGFVLFKVYDSSRFTRDVDAVGKNIDIKKIKELVPAVLTNDIRDGIWFGDISVQDILDQDEYGGLRFTLAFQIGNVPAEKEIKHLSKIHFDIGVGDFIPDDLVKSQTSLLAEKDNFLSWKVYPLEYIFSEKLQTLVKRKEAMSRAKDIYDLIWLFDCCEDKKNIFIAIEKTFSNRKTNIPSSWTKFIDLLSPDLIKKSWGSIQFLEEDMTFKQAWEKLKNIFKEMDMFSM